MSSSAEIEARFPPTLEFLFRPARYKVAYGGRGGAKSWGFARALLLAATQRKLRVLCVREIQKSIKDSVHKLLSDQIEALGLGAVFDVLTTEIRCRNGSEFMFSGLADQTASSIKSMEGADICWIEEAQAVSQRSLDILFPTIRRPGSEIWVSFNPELDTDAIYRRFVINPPPDAVVVKINWNDNEWFPPELERERLWCKEHDPEQYDWIWEGHCRAAAEGAIYAREVAELEQGGHFQNLPYDPKLKAHVVVDLGFNDAMAIIIVQRSVSEIRVIDYIEDSHRTVDSYSAQLKDMRLNWGKLYLPHDGWSKSLAAGGQSIAALFRKLGWQPMPIPDASVEDGIKTARMALKRTWFDRSRATRLIECLKRYRRNVPTTTGEPSTPVHDEYSHGADAYRYLALVADQLRNEEGWAPLNYSNASIV